MINKNRKSGKDFLANFVPCGSCPECLEARRSEWTFRIMNEFKRSESGVFLTLTYDEEHVPIIDGERVLIKKDLQNYFKRCRAVKNDFKYYGVGEYGGLFKRPHFHAIVLNCPAEILVTKWDKGNITCGSVTQKSIHYVTGYIINDYPKDFKFRPFSVISKGLGLGYVNDKTKKYHNDLKSSTVTFPGGVRSKMPRYYKEKIFDKITLTEIGLKNAVENDERMNKTANIDLQNERKAKIKKVSLTKKSKK